MSKCIDNPSDIMLEYSHIIKKGYIKEYLFERCRLIIENNAIENYFYIEKDLYRKNIKPSTLDKPKILEYYINGWRYWN